MSRHLTRDDVAHVAELARLHLDESELDLFTEQLEKVLEHAEDIERLDVGEVPPTAHPLPMHNVFRPDVVGASIDRDELLASAPAAEAGQFRVPQILGDEP